MSSLSSGQTLRLRAKSRVASNRVGYVVPEFPVEFRQPTAGATNQRMFVAPARCKVVAITEIHGTPGTGGFVVSVRKQLAASASAVNAAISAPNVVSIAEVAVDGSANVSRTGTITAATATLATGDKLVFIVPAVVTDLLITAWLVWV